MKYVERTAKQDTQTNGRGLADNISLIPR